MVRVAPFASLDDEANWALKTFTAPNNSLFAATGPPGSASYIRDAQRRRIEKTVLGGGWRVKTHWVAGWLLLTTLTACDFGSKMPDASRWLQRPEQRCGLRAGRFTPMSLSVLDLFTIGKTPPKSAWSTIPASPATPSAAWSGCAPDELFPGILNDFPCGRLHYHHVQKPMSPPAPVEHRAYRVVRLRRDGCGRAGRQTADGGWTGAAIFRGALSEVPRRRQT